MTNKLSYFMSCIFVLIAHGIMMYNVFINGNYDNPNSPFTLAFAVGVIDLAYFIILPRFRQKTYAVNFMLILILNMSLIFQSCFGEIKLDIKHMITCVSALVACHIGCMFCKNYNWVQRQFIFYYGGIFALLIIILLFTGERSMWIDLGFISIQPSEFIKPLLVLVCGTAVVTQQDKIKIFNFYIVEENVRLFLTFAVVVLFQWWCRDLGSIPTFMAIYASGFLLRICYPKAKFSRRTIITACSCVAVLGIIAIIVAPPYVKERIFADIWNNPDENGYQQTKALIGIAEGGWFGKGAGNGWLCNVFAYESDIVFATVCEEWGLLYAVMTVLMILIMIAMPLINPPRSYYHGTVCAGVCAAFTVQMALNIFGSCNMIPFTGVTLPFISAGGSSMVVSGFMIGMISASQSPEFKNYKGSEIHKKKNSILERIINNEKY